MNSGSDSFLIICARVEVFEARRQVNIAQDLADAKFDAKGFGRAARCELALQPVVSVAKRWASLCSAGGVGLTYNELTYFIFATPKTQNFQ